MTLQEKLIKADEMAATSSPSLLALTVIDQAERIKDLEEKLYMSRDYLQGFVDGGFEFNEGSRHMEDEINEVLHETEYK